nr:hypothetical protein [Mycoplasmopsis bovis]
MKKTRKDQKHSERTLGKLKWKEPEKEGKAIQKIGSGEKRYKSWNAIRGQDKKNQEKTI